MTDRESIIRRIKALQARTTDRGCTEAEALSAAKVASRLINQHQLSMTDIEIGEERCETTYLDTGRRAMHEIQYSVASIATYTDTKAWFRTSRDGDKTICLFGLPADVAFASFLVTSVKTAMDCELIAYKARCRQLGEPTGRRQSHAFLMGMSTRINDRLRAMKQEQRQENVASTGRDLVPVKSGLVQSQFRALGLRLRSSGGSTRIGDSSSYSAGKAAGSRVGLNRPVGSNNGGYLIGR